MAQVRHNQSGQPPRPGRRPIAADACIALYPRVSSDEQLKGRGIPVQLAGMDLRLRDRPKVARRVYAEDYTATTLNRPKLNELRADIAAGKVHTVVFYSPDRVARNVKDALTLIDEFEAAGVAVEFCTFEWNNSDEGRAALVMQFAFAEYEGRQIRARTVRGIRSCLDAKQFPRGAPFGYVRVSATKSLIEDKETAGIVREFFKRYDAGWTLAALTRWAAREGYRSPRGKPWCRMSIRKLLRTDTYLGEAIFGRTQIEIPAAKRDVGPLGGRSPKVIHTPESEWKRIQVPALVERAVWDRVQRRLAANTAEFESRPTYGRPGNLPALLRRLAVCGLCGRKVYAVTGCAKKVPRYRCPSRAIAVPLTPCRAGTWNLAIVDAAVRAAFATFASDPARVCASLMRRRSKDRAAAVTRVTLLTKQRAALEGKIERAYGLYVEQGHDKKVLQGIIAGLGKQRDAIEVDLMIARGSAQMPDAERITDWGAAVSRALTTASAADVVRLLRTVCVRAVMTHDAVTLELVADRLAPASVSRGAGAKDERGNSSWTEFPLSSLGKSAVSQGSGEGGTIPLRVPLPIAWRTLRGRSTAT